MICPTCSAYEAKSIVTELGSSRTCVYYAPFFDEHGRRHHHDGNVTASAFRCSKGHIWETKETGSCWCGWPESDTKPEGAAG